MQSTQLLTLEEASTWATSFLNRHVSQSNISYLVQYGKVRRYKTNGSVCIDTSELERYYRSFLGRRELDWKKRLGDDLNWALSFDHLREKDTTKHVHRLHPYKGKFIPQLVEYFIDDHVDDFKKGSYFKTGDIVLDPFSGSGTTLVQASEMGMHSIGIDISHFNCTIADVKLSDYDHVALETEVRKIKTALAGYETDNNITAFENELMGRLAEFNNKHFFGHEFKFAVQQGSIDEAREATGREREFIEMYQELVQKYHIELQRPDAKTFLDKWYISNVRKEIDFVFERIKEVEDIKIKKVLGIILSRTIRSCRATTHSDLATLKTPQLTTYYCWKHKKICKPLFSIKSWFERYAGDTVQRLKVFARLKKDVYYSVIPADSRSVDIFKEVDVRDKPFSKILKKQKIRGIFSSPPYVGQIDYHEQHAYAYDLFGFKRQDELEIGPLYKGQGMAARESYVEGISNVLLNCKKYLVEDYDVFLVANDKYGLYPKIAERSNMQIVNQFKRPVLNRTERDKNPYSEIIFHLKQHGLCP